MIEINLLPEEQQKKEQHTAKVGLSKLDFSKIDLSKIDLRALPLARIGVAILGTLIVIQVILFLIGIYVKFNLYTMERRYKDILPKKNEAEQMKAQIATINKKVSAIDELMVKRFSWAKKLNDLSESMTPGIWLTELSYTEKVIERPVVLTLKAEAKAKPNTTSSKTVIEKSLATYLVISGYATSLGEDGTAAVGKFIKNLKDNRDFYTDFNDIELGAIKREKIEDQEVMSFKITCLFREAK